MYRTLCGFPRGSVAKIPLVVLHKMRDSQAVKKTLTYVIVQLQATVIALRAKITPLTLMTLGYARVSTDDQKLTSQRAELQAAGCSKLFAERVSCVRSDCPELTRMHGHLRPGDVVTVPKLDRLARSTRELLGYAKLMIPSTPHNPSFYSKGC